MLWDIIALFPLDQKVAKSKVRWNCLGIIKSYRLDYKAEIIYTHMHTKSISVTPLLIYRLRCF